MADKVLFPISKDLVEQLIKVYSNHRDCGGRDSKKKDFFTCCVCDCKFYLCSRHCDNHKIQSEYCSDFPNRLEELKKMHDEFTCDEFIKMGCGPENE